MHAARLGRWGVRVHHVPSTLDAMRVARAIQDARDAGNIERGAAVTDQIVLKGISAKGYHGVLDFEKRDGQTFVVDVTMHVDLAPAGTSDDLADTVNYAEVAGDVVALIEGDSLDLIEALASRIADRVLARPLVEAVEVVGPQARGAGRAPVHRRAGAGQPGAPVARSSSRWAPTSATPSRRLHDAAIALYGLIDIIEVSPVVETDPVGGPDQPAYLNAVVTGTTHLAPSAAAAPVCTTSSGRTDGPARSAGAQGRWTSTSSSTATPVFDTDVVMDGPTLTLPHPRAHERGFVLVPWLEADSRGRAADTAGCRRVADLVCGMDLGRGPASDLLEGRGDRGPRAALARQLLRRPRGHRAVPGSGGVLYLRGGGARARRRGSRSCCSSPWRSSSSGPALPVRALPAGEAARRSARCGRPVRSTSPRPPRSPARRVRVVCRQVAHALADLDLPRLPRPALAAAGALRGSLVLTAAGCSPSGCAASTRPTTATATPPADRHAPASTSSERP